MNKPVAFYVSEKIKDKIMWDGTRRVCSFCVKSKIAYIPRLVEPRITHVCDNIREECLDQTASGRSA